MSKKYNYDYIQFKVSPEEKKEIKDMKKKHRYSTMSDFIREAIRDKINRLENPELERMKKDYKEIRKQNEKLKKEMEEFTKEIYSLVGNIRNTVKTHK